MDMKILMILLGIIIVVLMYKHIKKGNISDFTLIRAWGIMIIAIIMVIICFVKVLFNLD